MSIARFTPEQAEKDLPIAYGKVLPPGTCLSFAGIRFITRSYRIEVICPYCGKKHIHGWPANGSFEEGGNGSTRLSHCNYSRDYRLKAEGEA